MNNNCMKYVTAYTSLISIQTLFLTLLTNFDVNFVLFIAQFLMQINYVRSDSIDYEFR